MTRATERRSGVGFVAAVVTGLAVAGALVLYAEEHQPKPHPLFQGGFSSYVQLKVWLATAAAVLVLVQLLTALWMWGRLPGARGAPPGVAVVHRWSGAVAFVLLVPVALNCLYSLGFATADARTYLHSIAGCAFYGGYAAKMLALRLRGLPNWALPLLGGTVLTCFAVVWSTSAAWFLQSGRPLT